MNDVSGPIFTAGRKFVRCRLRVKTYHLATGQVFFFSFFFFSFLSFFLFFFCFCLINGIQKTDILKSGLVRNHSLDGTVEIRFTMPLPALMVWRKTTCFFLNFRHFSNVLEGYDILLQTPWSTLSIKAKYKSEWRRASVNSDQNVRAG